MRDPSPVDVALRLGFWRRTGGVYESYPDSESEFEPRVGLKVGSTSLRLVFRVLFLGALLLASPSIIYSNSSVNTVSIP